MVDYFTRAGELTPEQYQESPVDFYNMPKIEAEVIDTDDDDDDDQTSPVVANVLTPVTAGGDEAPQPNIFTQTTFSGRPAYDVQTIDYNDFIKNFDQMDDVKTQKGIDRVKSGFSDFLSQTISDPGKLIGSTAFSAMGNPFMAPVMHFAGSLNRKQQLDTARAIQRSATPFKGNEQIASQVSFAGNMMSVNGQVVHRSPGKQSYNGTLPDIPDAGRTLYRQEEITKGYIPGTMRETESAGPDGNPSGSFVTSGKYGLLDEATAKALGGNFDAYGNFHTAYGSAGGGTMKAAKALAAQYGVPESSIKAMIEAINNGTYSKGFFGTTRSVKLSDYRNDRMIAIDIIKSFTPEAVQKREEAAEQAADEQKQQDVMDAAEQASRDELARIQAQQPTGPGEDSDHDKDSDSESGSGAGGSYGLSHALGGRVGYAPGGPVQQGSPAGFVERPPSQVSEAATVADDKPMSVSEGTFVINAAAVEFAGEEDIADMLKKAYVKAGKKDMGGPSTQEIDIAVSRGEVIVPAHIAKIIGYDRLEKINNRGKAETSKRIKENGQQPAGAAGGGFLTRKKLANGGEADDYEDKIVIDEVRRKMDSLMDEVAARDDPVEVLSNYFESGSAQKEYDDAQAEKNQRVPIGGRFYKAAVGEHTRINVPKTPTLFNLFAMAEEVAHLDSHKPGNPKTRKNPYSKPEYSLFKDFNNVTGGLFSGTPVMGQDYDAHETFNLEGKYLEEMRAKQIAFQTVFGGLAERQVENTKAGKTIKYTKASYQKMFADYISAFASPVVKAAFFEKYPDLKSVYRETPVDEQLKEQSDTEYAKERGFIRQELQKKAMGGFLSMENGEDVGEDVPMDDRIRLPKSTEKKFKTYLASRQQRGDVERLIDSLDDRERLAVLALVETTAAKDPLESLMGVGQTVINRANSNRKDFKNVNDIPAVLKQRSGRGTGSKMFQYDGLEPKNIKPRLEEVLEGRVPGAITKMFMAADNLLDPEAQSSPIISKFVTSYTKPDAPLAKDMELNPLMRYSTSIGGHDYYTLEAAPESPDQKPIFEAYKEAKREAAKNKKK